MSDENDPQTAQWHIDKRINLATIVPLVVATVAALTWAGSVETRIGFTEERIRGLEATDDRRAGEMLRVEGRLSSLEATSKEQLRTLERIETLLSRQLGDSP